MARPENKAGTSPLASQADADIAGQLCSICQTVILAGELVLRCPDCSLPFHGECWAENRGCSAYGCQSVEPAAKAAPVQQPASNAWGDEKPCPACQKSIKAEALKCRHCGATFQTRDVISREEYVRREYEGTEYTVARNRVVAFFLLSASGCLAPVGLLFSGLLIHNGKLMGIEYHRLPSTLKALAWSGMGIGGLLLIILVLLVAFDR